VGRWNTYYPKRHKEYVAEATPLLPAPDVTFTGPVIAEVNLVFEKARTSKLLHPHPDIDNLAKMVYDLLTAVGVWKDDKQIVVQKTAKRFAFTPSEVGTHIKIIEVPD
jgi:Holliday junction resolvase RusA-like endonuclease